MLREVSGCRLECIHGRWKGVGRLGLALSLLVVLVGGWAAFGQTDIAIVALHVGWVEQTTMQERSLSLDQALVGDTVRVSARCMSR